MDLKNLTIKKFHQGLIDKEFSVFEITKEFFSSIKEKDKEIGAYLKLTEDMAESRANKIDIKISNGDNIGILEGIPLAIKDNILIKGEITTAASKFWKIMKQVMMLQLFKN